MKKLPALFIALLVIATACDTFLPKEPKSEELLDGPVDGLSQEQQRLFLAGDEAFNDQVFTPETGLGPVFVASSCGSCHAGDGKGHPFSTLTRFAKYENGEYDYLLTKGGPQLQHRAIPGFTGEILPEEANAIAKFIAPANTGLGFLEAVNDADLYTMSDPDDKDGDGISGAINWIIPADYHFPKSLSIVDTSTGNKRYIGRFGKKCGTINLKQQTIVAYKQDMGITTDFDTKDIFNYATGEDASDNIADPELPSSTVNKVVFYLRTLKAPLQRNPGDKDVLVGKSLFINTGCVKCHKPVLKTGKSDIDALSYKEFHPYTDLLVHDMGPSLDDKYSEGTAKSYEWRTAPLWGLGLAKESQGGQYYLLHDGRAKSIEEAVSFHGGEARGIKNNFNALSSEDKSKIIKFLESL